ncbi:hypothetical protein [uncultured Erythrobacter sp.]|uniref:hypothetical protein n=1 Tax=uncultured Erythrobacter sp. TaxID=263913 RepID=UPI00260B0F4E|nr:hypothetical protein [uncultured Erythrobacter sp.]
MTKSDQTGTPTRTRPFLGQMLFYFGVSVVAGAIGACLMFIIQGRLDSENIGVTAALIVVGAAMVFAAIRVGNFDRPSFSSNTGRSQLILLSYVLLGALLAIYINAIHLDSIVEGTFQLTRIEAIAGLTILAAIIPVATFQWKQLDDFQRTAMKDAIFWTFNVYIYGYMAWVIGAFGGLFSPVDHYVIFVVVTFTYLFVWTFKRSG